MVYVSAAIIINQQLLLIRREGSHNWTPPSGKLKEGETELEGLERVVKQTFPNATYTVQPKPYKSIDYSTLTGIPSLNKVYLVELTNVSPDYQKIRAVKLLSDKCHVNLSNLALKLIDNLDKDGHFKPNNYKL